MSDEDEDDQDSDDREERAEEHTSFPLFPAGDVCKRFGLILQGSRGENISNGKTKSRSNNNHDSGERDNDYGAGGYEGEMVGLGFATLPRHGGSSLLPVSTGRSDQERKRTWSEVEQAKQEIEEEEVAAILASEKRERRG